MKTEKQIREMIEKMQVAAKEKGDFFSGALAFASSSRIDALLWVLDEEKEFDLDELYQKEPTQ